LTSPFAGEALGATNVLSSFFTAASNPVVVLNGIGATLAATGLVTLLAGTYLVETGMTAYNLSVSLSNNHFLIVNSTTLTNYINNMSVAAQFSTGGEGFPDNWFAGASPSIIWNTSTLGTVIGLAASNQFASGSVVNNGWLRITLL
jgi:hypothetical protein